MRRGVCRAVCSVRAAVWRAVMSAQLCGMPTGVRCLRVYCDVRGLLACAVLGDTHHNAAVPLCWVSLRLVASCVSARACAWCDCVGERGASRLVREVRVGPAIM